MKITYYQGTVPNFGDDLNPWMWPKIIPGFFDDDEKAVFLGIGSIIGEKQYPPTVKKILFGAGFVPGYRRVAPDVKGPDWSVYFVRGPRTARMLDIAPELGIGDFAILLRTLIKPKTPASGVISFIPHWESMERGNWAEACRLAGLNLIDPRTTVEKFIDGLQKSRMVITEAMHGAIVADALRVPWIPMIPTNTVHRDKWFDWADSLEMPLHPRRLWPSTLTEARLSVLRKPIAESPFAGIAQKTLVHAAAYRLARLAKTTPSLSEDRVIDRNTDRMLEKVAQLRKDFG